MNLSEAAKQRIERVRKPMWANPKAYLKLYITPQGLLAITARLYDDDGQIALGLAPGSQQIIFYQGIAIFGDDWEAYTGEPSPHEADYHDYDVRQVRVGP